MDLNRIELWTRKALEAEAARRGIREPELRARTELIRLILRHQYGKRLTRAGKRVAEGLHTLQQARALLGVAMDAAAENIDAAAESLPGPLGKVVQLGVQLSLPFRKTSAGTVRAPSIDGAPVDAAAPTGTRPPASTATGGEPASAAATYGEPASAAATPTVRRFEQEPIRTHSMARLLACQGHRERALAIYEELLARDTTMPALREEAEVLRAGGDLTGIPNWLPDPPDELPTPPTGDRIQCDGKPQDGIGVRWTVTPEGTARAGAVLGQPGELAIRLVTISPDPERVVRSVITEYGPVAASGSWRTDPFDPPSRCFVAIGLRAADRFVSIAHAKGLG